jgi:phosphocarrier protein
MSERKQNDNQIHSVEVVLPCRFGLHVRNATLFLRFIERFESAIRLRHRNMEVNGRSALGLLTLGAAWRSTIIIITEGPDAQKAAQEIQEYLSDPFHCEDGA